MKIPKSSELLAGSLQEVKEAVADALVGLVSDRISGAGPDGREVMGRTPKSAFVSGLLLPRFDSTGDDDTSDIHVSVVGIDTQIHTAAKGTLAVQPGFTLYVRVLPSWADVEMQREDIAKGFSLAPEFAKKLAELTAEIRKRRVAEAGLEGTVPAADKSQRRARRETMNAIRREAYREARAALGLPAVTGTPDSASLLPDVPPEGQASEPEDADAARPRVLAADTLATLIASPPGSIAPIDVPMKWVRIVPKPPPLNLQLEADTAARDASIQAYNEAVASGMREAFESWLNEESGAQWLWRDERVVPSDLKDEAAWNAYLTRARTLGVDLDKCAPCLTGIATDVSIKKDFADPSRYSLRISLENTNRAPARTHVRTRELSVFQVSLAATLPGTALAPLRLDRIDPSYRFRNHLTYPAMGLNCGVDTHEEGDATELRITWSPRWVQPRLVAAQLPVECRFSELSKASFVPASLLTLPQEYRRWIDRMADSVRGEISPIGGREGERELDSFAKSLDAQRREADLIEKGVRILVDSAAASKRGDGRGREAMPWRAWCLMNEAFLRRENGAAGRGWRLFQLAFVLAHLSNVVSREREWAHLHDPAFDEETASLLYFPTGGGKSEAFYGVLLFAMFFDRLRGKSRGVTGLVRYPLRLLTLQQAQRVLRLLVQAEMLRAQAGVGSWPFELGFWVGRGNTPNRVRSFTSSIPAENDAQHKNDARLIADAKRGDKAAKAYIQDLEAYNKVPLCPVCGGETGLRRFDGVTDADRRVGIVCFSPPESCAWNAGANVGHRKPLPFLLSDDTIYQRAPAVIVGTVDKLAMLGQDIRTIAAVLGMFGLARWVLPNGHLMVPRTAARIAAGMAESRAEPVYPAYASGQRVFYDPFPTLIIQDEGHLLEESLGTFSGLFESLLETVFRHVGSKYQSELGIAVWNGPRAKELRTPRVVMATATVSRPEGQLVTLYQRNPVLFPSPGHDIWRSFFAEPAQPPEGNSERAELWRRLPPHLAPEMAAPWMRVFVSMMTNGSNHTVTTVSVISAFHEEITRAWRHLQDPAKRAAEVERLRGAIRGRGAEWRRKAVDRIVAQGRHDLLLALIDLHRVSITYVTNKKGGDQVIDALDGFTRGEHARAGLPIRGFRTALISGGVDMRDIQAVMRLAERGPAEGGEWPDIDADDLLRNVVATSAISHGVDVDRFNSMFFAGLPSDVAEYIQASSRVGRTHVGFVILVPTPYSRRDRYVVETHDIFHRFLERMIAAPASERWAENALHRVAASYIQAWISMQEFVQFAASPDEAKQCAELDLVPELERRARGDKLAMGEEIADFAMKASGLAGRGQLGIGRPSDAAHYRNLQLEDAHQFVNDVLEANTTARLSDFWKARAQCKLLPPMTSLRDVDEAAVIRGSSWSQVRRKKIDLEALYYAMKIVRGQRYARSETEADAAPEVTDPQEGGNVG
jgi:hypothetical protein